MIVSYLLYGWNDTIHIDLVQIISLHRCRLFHRQLHLCFKAKWSIFNIYLFISVPFASAYYFLLKSTNISHFTSDYLWLGGLTVQKCTLWKKTGLFFWSPTSKSPIIFSRNNELQLMVVCAFFRWFICLFNLYAEYIMRNTGLEEAQAGIKIDRRNINNLR